MSEIHCGRMVGGPFNGRMLTHDDLQYAVLPPVLPFSSASVVRVRVGSYRWDALECCWSWESGG